MMLLVYATLVVVLSGALLWHWKLPTIRRALFFSLVATIGIAAALDSLGGPKPHWAEWRTGEMLVVAAEFIPDKAIFIWVRGKKQPTAYELPWSEETAKELQSKLRGAKESGRDGIRVSRFAYGEMEEHPEPVTEQNLKE